MAWCVEFHTLNTSVSSCIGLVCAVSRTVMVAHIQRSIRRRIFVAFFGIRSVTVSVQNPANGLLMNSMRITLSVLLFVFVNSASVPDTWVRIFDDLKSGLAKNPGNTSLPELLQQHIEKPPLLPSNLGAPSNIKSSPAAIWRHWIRFGDPSSFLPHCIAAIAESTGNSPEAHLAASDHFAACFGLGHSSSPSPSRDPYYLGVSKGVFSALGLQSTLDVSKHLDNQRPRLVALLRNVIPARPPRPRDARLRVGILCPLTPHMGGGEGRTSWGPDTAKRGISGAEEAVIYLSRALVGKGFHVEIYGQPDQGRMMKAS